MPCFPLCDLHLPIFHPSGRLSLHLSPYSPFTVTYNHTHSAICWPVPLPTYPSTRHPHSHFPVHSGSNSPVHPSEHPVKHPSAILGEAGPPIHSPITRLSNQLPVYPLTNPTTHLPVHLPIHPPTHPFIYPPSPTCLSTHLPLHSTTPSVAHPFILHLPTP